MKKRIQWNIISNFIGKGTTILSLWVFVPIYVKFVGIEAFGLIGFYTVLLNVFAFTDFGLSTTLNREIAQSSQSDNDKKEIRSVIYTLERIFIVIVGSLTLFLIILSPYVARYWIKAGGLQVTTVESVVAMMAFAMAMQILFSFYQGGLYGLQQQVLSNAILVIAVLLKAGGVVVVLSLYSPTIQAYFVWQIFINVMQVLVIRFALWRLLPAGHKPRFKWPIISKLWRYSLGMTGITILSTLLIQMDRLILSRQLSLDEFGYYSLASLIGQVPVLLTSPITIAIFPILAQLSKLRNVQNLSIVYHRYCQVITVLVIPIGLVIITFSKEIMEIWTGSITSANKTYFIVSILVIGSSFLALQTVPYVLALANGWTKLNVIMGSVQLLVFLPLMFFMSNMYGGLGAALVWGLLNICSTPIYLHFIHKRLLPNQLSRWYIFDVLTPVLAAVTVVFFARYLVNTDTSFINQILTIGFVWLIAFVAACITASEVRNLFLSKIFSVRSYLNV